jgi:hypothetical protein
VVSSWAELEVGPSWVKRERREGEKRGSWAWRRRRVEPKGRG